MAGRLTSGLRQCCFWSFGWPCMIVGTRSDANFETVRQENYELAEELQKKAAGSAERLDPDGVRASLRGGGREKRNQRPLEWFGTPQNKSPKVRVSVRLLRKAEKGLVRDLRDPPPQRKQQRLGCQGLAQGQVKLNKALLVGRGSLRRVLPTWPLPQCKVSYYFPTR